jgi:hypothetical protein
MGVVRRRGVLTHAVAIYCHLAIDGPGLAVLTADLANLDRVTGREVIPVAGLRPLELARQQRTPAAQRQSRAALRHWQRLLHAIPPPVDAESQPQRGPHYWHLDCRSPALYLALRKIAARTRVDSGHVLLAAYAVMLARVTGTNPSVSQVLVSNRFRPGCAESVSHLTQTGLVVIDVADSPFDEVVARSWKASMAASMYGYYDAGQQSQVFQQVCRERGLDLDIPSFFNDRRRRSRPAANEPEPSPDEVRAALPLTTMRFSEQRDWFGGLLFLHVNDAPDTIDLTAWGNISSLSRAELEDQMRQFESSIVAAAMDPDTTSGITASRSTVDQAS